MGALPFANHPYCAKMSVVQLAQNLPAREFKSKKLHTESRMGATSHFGRIFNLIALKIQVQLFRRPSRLCELRMSFMCFAS
jgi:hypothetical protein